MDDAPEDIVRRNIFYILGQLYPNAVISHRSAFELKPTAEGDIFLTYTYTKLSLYHINALSLYHFTTLPLYHFTTLTLYHFNTLPL